MAAIERRRYQSATMTHVAVDSSMLAAVGYDHASQELEAVFVDGAVWRYCDVPEKVYQELLATDSKGGYMRDFIIDIYSDYRVRRRA